METLERAYFLLRSSNKTIDLPINMTAFFHDVIPGVQIAVLRQALLLADNYSPEDALTFLYYLSKEMLSSFSDDSEKAKDAQAQTLSSSQLQAVITALTAYGLANYLASVAEAGLINDLNTSNVLTALSALP